MLRPGTDVSSSPWLRHCLQDRITSLLHVMHAAKYREVEASCKNCHTNIYFKTKTVVPPAAKCWTQCHIFPSIQFSYTQLYRWLQPMLLFRSSNCFKEQPFQTLQQHDVSWEKSVQFYDILIRFIINDFETNRNENTMTKKSTEAKYLGKTKLVSVKFPFRRHSVNRIIFM